MTKKDFVKKYAEKTGTSLKVAEEFVEAFMTTVEDAMLSKETVQFVGWGTFEPTHSEAREGRNPATGETVQIAAKNGIKFKAGKALKDKLNA